MKILCILMMVICAMGCQTVGRGTKGADESSMIGLSAAKVLADANGLRTEIYGDDGKRLEQIPAGQRGSVSVFAKDGKSQDNYTFEKDGLISKHMRSDGDGFLKGVWRTVEQ